MDNTPFPDVAASRIDDGRSSFDAPIRDTLLRMGYLTAEQTERVRTHQVDRGLDFDQAALELGFINSDDLDTAREQLLLGMALQDTKRREVSDELVVVHDASSVRSESIRLLRTQIIAQHIRSGRRGLAFVAPVDGVGCSYLAANVAAALSQVGMKTLLIDANMRTPRMSAMFGLDPEAPGLSSFLSLKVARPERVVHANVLPSLSVMTAGPSVDRPQELLSQSRFRDGCNALLREYDLVIFDTPAANTNADALTIGAAAGYALVVARRDHSYFNDVGTLIDQLAAARCPVIGSVLNEF
jgi:capsular exopolysaccharide synthesis family protein